MKTNTRKTLKISGALLSGIAFLTIPAITLVSCGEIKTPPAYQGEDHTNWTWEKLIKGEFKQIASWVNKASYEEIEAAGWEQKTEILLADWNEKFPGVEYIMGGLSYNELPNLEYVEIPNTVKMIGNDAFRGFEYDKNHLKRGVQMPDSILYYGPRSFEYSKTPIRLSESTMRIGERAFFGSVTPVHIETDNPSQRPNLKLPSSIWKIEKQAFAGIKPLPGDNHIIELSFTNSKNLEYIGVAAFGGSAFSTELLQLPRSLKEFNFNSFYGDISVISFSSASAGMKLIYPANEDNISINDWYWNLTVLTLPENFRTDVENSTFFTKDGIKYYYLSIPN